MARVTIFEGGNIQREGTTDARVRPADFSASPLAEGLQAAGKALAHVAEKQDEIDDVQARVEANRLAVEHSEHAREIGRRVKQTLGEGADAAATTGIGDLDKATKDILGRASPRARLLLESELRQRTGVASDEWLGHGYQQKSDALESSSVARIDRVIEDAADVADEAQGRAILAEVDGINRKRASFFGKDENWLRGENAKATSTFFKSRALKIATGPRASASAAIAYAENNRRFLSDDDYNSIVSAYTDNALDEMVAAEQDGSPIVASATDVDPLAPIPEGSAAGAVAARALDPDAFIRQWVLPTEGGYGIDNDGAEVNFGINKRANPDVDVRNLTQARATQIYKDRYWGPSGAASMPPALAAIHMDTYIMGPEMARQALQASGGDIDKYMEFRESFQRRLAQKDPAKFPPNVMAAWARRNKEIMAFANRQGGATVAAPISVDPTASLEDYRTKTMARTDIGLAFKTKLINNFAQKRALAAAEMNQVTDQAERDLMEGALGLGDDFTDVKQLPQDAWLRADVATRTRMTSLADQNKRAKPVPLDVEVELAMELATNPKAFANPKTLAKYAAKGVPAARLAQLAQAGGQAVATVGKPDAIPQSDVVHAIRETFKAQGLPDFWGVDGQAKKGSPAHKRELAEDSQKRLALIGFVDQARQTWAINNPGKRPPPEVVNGWVAFATRRVSQGGDFSFEATHIDLYNGMNPRIRDELVRELRSQLGGKSPTVAQVARAYREAIALGKVR